MLNWIKRHRLWAAIIVASLILAAFVVTSLLIPLTGEICSKDEYSGQKNCAPYNVVLAALWQIVKSSNDFGAAITALGTLAVAAFTLTLWRATDKLWRASEKALQTTERAFVFIDGFNVELTTAADAEPFVLTDLPERYQNYPELFITRFAVQPKWKNGGNTPTKRMKICIDWRGPPTGLLDYEYRTNPVAFFIAPKAVEPRAIVEMPGAQALIDHGLFSRLGDEPLMLIWGRADYKDVFENQHFIEWCYRVRFDRHDGKKLRVSFIQWNEHNQSDEELPNHGRYSLLPPPL
jgi:hypothetical protein